MKNRKLGQIQVSPMGMGCMGFSHGYGKVPEESYSAGIIGSNTAEKLAYGSANRAGAPVGENNSLQ